MSITDVDQSVVVRVTLIFFWAVVVVVVTHTSKLHPGVDVNGYCGQGLGRGGILGDGGSDACRVACNAMDGEGRVVLLLQASQLPSGVDVDGDHGQG